MKSPVMVGLVPADLSDILFSPSKDSAVTKKRTNHITGTRQVMSMLRCLEKMRERRKRHKK